MMPKRATGVVKWFDAAKGYGFITQAEGPDVFVHHSAIESTGFRSLDAGVSVEFEVVMGNKGLEARSVRLSTSSLPGDSTTLPPLKA